MANPKFERLLEDIKKQPKDTKGKFLDRDFAKYVSKQLAEVRKSKKVVEKNAPKAPKIIKEEVKAKTPLSLNHKESKRPASQKTKSYSPQDFRKSKIRKSKNTRNRKKTK